jgi:hypothetical protein
MLKRDLGCGVEQDGVICGDPWMENWRSAAGCFDYAVDSHEVRGK